MQSESTLSKLTNEDTLAWNHISANADQNPGTGVHMQIAQAKLRSHWHLFVIADGVGSNADGGFASHIAVCDTLSSFTHAP